MRTRRVAAPLLTALALWLGLVVAPTPTQAAVVANTVTVTNPGFQRGRVHQPITPLHIQASDSDPNQTLQFSATGLPTGLSINAGTGVISGEPLRAGRYSVRVRVRDTTGAHDAVRFNWRIS